MQLTKVREMIILSVNNVECGSAVNCTLSGVCYSVAQKKNPVLLNYCVLIISLSDLWKTSIRQWDTCVTCGRGICVANNGGDNRYRLFSCYLRFLTV